MYANLLQTDSKQVIPINVSQSGAALYEIPIDLPAGKGGLKPNLSFKYNSYEKKDGMLGPGWGLHIGFIQKKRKKGFDEIDEYFVEQNGVLKQLIKNDIINDDIDTFSEKIERDFSKYHFDKEDNKWTLKRKDGIKYFYGKDNSSRIVDQNGVIHKWLLCEIGDSNGNAITISYTSDPKIYSSNDVTIPDGYNKTYNKTIEKYVEKIYYNNQREEDNKTYINFYYEFIRGPNEVPTFELSEPLYMFINLKHIVIKDLNQYVKKYSLHYEDEISVKRLHDIIIKSFDSVGTESEERIYSFNYSDNDLGNKDKSHINKDEPQILNNVGNNYNQVTYGDFDGDGKTDFIWWYKEDCKELKVSLASRMNKSFWYVLTQKIDLNNEQKVNILRAADFNNDGLDDIIIGTSESDEIRLSFLYSMIDNNGSWGLDLQNDLEVVVTLEDYNIYDLLLGDVNGDGKVDIIPIFMKSNSLDVYIYKNMNDKFEKETETTIEMSIRHEVSKEFPGGHALRNNTWQCIDNDTCELDNAKYPHPYANLTGISLADFNGDGCSDLIAHYNTNSRNKEKIVDNCTYSDWYLSCNKNNYVFSNFHFRRYIASKRENISKEEEIYFAGDEELTEIPIGRLDENSNEIENNVFYYAVTGKGISKTFSYKIYDCNGDGFSDIAYFFNLGMVATHEIKDLSLDNTKRRVPITLDKSIKKLTIFYGNGKDKYYSQDFVLRTSDIDCKLSVFDINKDGTFDIHYQNNSGLNINNQDAIDINGDGLLEIVSFSGYNMYVNYWNKNSPPNLLTNISDSLGPSVSFAYTASSKYSNSYLPFIIHPVYTSTIEDISTAYEYSGGFYDINEREFRGFRCITKTKPDSSIEKKFFEVEDEYLKGNMN